MAESKHYQQISTEWKLYLEQLELNLLNSLLEGTSYCLLGEIFGYYVQSDRTKIFIQNIMIVSKSDLTILINFCLSVDTKDQSEIYWSLYLQSW